MESLAFQNVDQALIAQGHHRVPAGHHLDKSDLGIATSCPATGIIRSDAIQYADHVQGYNPIAEFPDMDDGFDMGFDYSHPHLQHLLPAPRHRPHRHGHLHG
jgi:hypothetical protein